MNILFPLIKAGSGSDIFTCNLVSGLNKRLVKNKILFLPGWSGVYPPVAGYLCNSSGYDILHTNTWNAYAFKADIPLVATEHHVVHDPEFYRYKSRGQKYYHKFIHRYERKSLDQAQAVTCVSKYTQKMLKQVFGYSDSHLIYNGIDTNLFKPAFISRQDYGIPDDVTILLNIGNLSNRKGSDLLSPIMKELGDKYVLFTSAGLRPNRYINSPGIRSIGKVNFNSLLNFYNLCDILLFPTRLEGFGLSVAEAMACEKPIVTTDCSSLPELVEQDKGGILCELDNIHDYANAVRYLAEDENLRKKMGNFNRNKVLDMFTIDRMTEKYVALYHGLI